MIKTLSDHDKRSILRIAASLEKGCEMRRALLSSVLLASYRKGDLVEYKGRPYRVLYSGRTRYGMKAKLQYLDGSKEFWVPLDRVSPSRRPSPSRNRGRGRMVTFQYWDGRRERMSEEDAEMLEDNGSGVVS